MNFNLPYLIGKDVVYIGVGKEKTSLEEFLSKYSQIKDFKYINPKNDSDFTKKLSEYDPDKTIFIKTPGIPGHVMNVPYTTVTRLFFDCTNQLGVNAVGVTGTKGKTTTSSLMAHTLNASGLDARLCGNAGQPMLDNLNGTTSETVMIVELSSFQLAELQQSPIVAIVTNLHENNVSYHGSLGAYWEAKHNIVRYMDEHGTVVFNPETEPVVKWLTECKARQMPIDPNESVDMSKSQLIGDHNKLNYLMVKQAATLFGISTAHAQEALASFEPVRHRLQNVRTVDGVTFIDDAVGSTPESTTEGIKALIQNKGPVGCVMLGGDDNKQDYTKLVQLLYRVAIPKLVLFPDTGSVIKSLISKLDGYDPEIIETSSMEEAVKWAAKKTPSGSMCLLSTAAPSTVLWDSFEEKGSLFQQAVLGL